MSDRAALAAALMARLRERGVATDLAAAVTFARALEVLPVLTPEAVHWAAKVTLVHRADDLAGLDEALADAVPVTVPDPVPVRRPEAVRDTEPDAESALPWLTPRAVATGTTAGPADEQDDGHGLPMPRPTPARGRLETGFASLGPEELDELGRWLAGLADRWPRRVSRRSRVDPRGGGLALRATLARARRTGWEPVELVRHRPRTRQRRVVMLCDVSRSMHADVPALLHLMRALVRGVEAEGFVFGTTPARLTAELRRGEAGAVAARVDDGLGGTRIAASLQALMRSPHGSLLRGAVVVVASDGWDSDEPARLAEAMARLRLRAHRVLWANPRAAAAGFEPRVATMAAALPYCDALVPAGTYAQLRDVLKAVACCR